MLQRLRATTEIRRPTKAKQLSREKVHTRIKKSVSNGPKCAYKKRIYPYTHMFIVISSSHDYTITLTSQATGPAPAEWSEQDAETADPASRTPPPAGLFEFERFLKD